MDTGKLAMGITTAAFAGFGAVLLAKPDILKRIGIRATNPNARTELRSMYGGMELGFGVFFFIALRNPTWRRPALTAILCSIGGLGATRVATAIAEDADPISYVMAAPEIAAAALAAVALTTE